MSKPITLYHGSQQLVRTPVLGGGKAHNDFGPGFYCTEDPGLAKEWACTLADGGYVNKYKLDTDGMRILWLNSEEYTLLNWIAVLVTHRTFRIKTPVAGRAKKYLEDNFSVNVDAYDLVTGYRADDAYFDFADAFLNNGLTVEQLGMAMRLGKLGEQIVLKSAFAFQQIRFAGIIPVDRSIYYPLRKARSDRAMEQYAALTTAESDGLYMADIMRQKVKNDDPRIPRNLSE